jgi:hypothetical protein
MSPELFQAIDEMVPPAPHPGDWQDVLARAAVSREQLSRVEVPRRPFPGDWSDVLARAPKTAEAHGHERRLAGRTRRAIPKRKVALVFAVVLAVLIPLGSLSAAEGWWFLAVTETPTTTTPTTTPESATTTPAHVLPPTAQPPAPLSGGPTVIKSGSWDGQNWTLVAYISNDGRVCFSVSPSDSVHTTGAGAAMSCASMEGVPQPAGTTGDQPLEITYLMNSGSAELAGYIAGPVVRSASTVEIHLVSGQVIEAPTFSGSPPLDQVAFYAAPLPRSNHSKPGDTSPVFTKLVGRDQQGRVVACFGYPYGPMPLSACVK